ncbi:hypothetical protein D6850_07685 [Roseovarius spongiae]|uniref:O-antigen ligase-related domain-containing protein n=1 Tax=Roseovarius spongiae TaxID=2320272 RepID=A0A3A8B337_9RHOB|nr:O-antigen ligase family protein [Roseovarius spongiae]RKF14752.1 hypothetical protein D6850_07685 [Roseovarius spongiae]
MTDGGASLAGRGGNPILGPGFAGLSGWVLAALLLGVSGLLGMALTLVDPVKIGILVVALVGCVFFMRMSLHHPVGTLCAIIFAQVTVPVYIRLPIPGLPSLPPPLLLIAGLSGVLLFRQFLHPTRVRTGRYERFLSTALLLYGAALVLTLPGNEHVYGGSVSMLVKTWVIPTFLFFILLSTIRTPGQLERVHTAILIAAVLSGMLGVHEFITRDNFIATALAPRVTIEEDFFLWLLANSDKSPPYIGGAIYRVYSFFTQPLEYSAFMVMAMPYPVLKFVTATTPGQRLIYGVAGLIIMAGFVVSFSRGPTLALVLVLLFLAIHERRVRPWLLVGLGLAVLALIVAWPFIADQLTERVSGSRNVTLRFRLWENGIITFLENPIRGIGYGSYPNYHAQSIHDHQIGPMYEYPWRHIESVTTVENIYVSLAAETGLLGLGAFFLLLGVYAYIFRKVMRLGDPRIRLLALTSAGATLAFLLSGMTVANIIGYTISILFFGVYIASIGVLSRRLPDHPHPSPAVLAPFVSTRSPRYPRPRPADGTG